MPNHQPLRPAIVVGSFVEWYRRFEEVGEVIRFDGELAVVRYEVGRDEQVHPSKLVWMPNPHEIAAEMARIRKLNDEAHRLSSVSHYRPGDARRIKSHNPRRGVTVGSN